MPRALFPVLALRAVDENLTFTRRKVTAWYRLPPVRSSFPNTTQFDRLIEDGGRRLAALVGRRLHVRRTTRPYPVQQWARDLHGDVKTNAAPLPGFAPMLRGQQLHLLGSTLATSEAYLGVELNTRPASASLAGRLKQHRNVEARQLAKARGQVDRIMAGPGLNARRATAAEVEWLLHRSVCLGMPAPLTLPHVDGAWSVDDLAQITDTVRWDCEPYDHTVRVSARVGNVDVVRHVAVVPLSRTVDPLAIPEEFEPWMQRSDRLDRPVEWCATVDVIPADRTVSWVQRVAATATSQRAHFEKEHHMASPRGLLRQEQKAAEVEDELTHGGPLSIRCDVWARAAVSGDTPEDALEAADQLGGLYEPHMTLVTNGFDQYRRAREFIPGEPLADVAYRRRFPVATVAAAMPQATAQVGHLRGGYYLGATCGTSERAVFWNLWRAMEVDERSGFTLIGGGLGAGKSVLLGLLCYCAALSGVPTTLLDPSARLQALTRLPELAGRSRHVPLMNADPGTLNPYRVVAEPKRVHYLFDDDGGRRDDADVDGLWNHARVVAGAQRKMLVADALLGLIPAAVADLPATHLAVLKAVRAVGGAYTRSPRHVLDELRDHGDGHAAQIADILDDAAAMPQGQLIFPAGDVFDQFRYDQADIALTVFTLKGLTQPRDGTDRRDWTLDELYSRPLMSLAAWLTQRAIYDTDPHERKLLGWDEGHDFTKVASGRALIDKTVRDTRKHDTRAVFSSQNVADVAGAKVGNFVDGVFVGRTEDPDAQRAAADMLGLGPEFGELLGGLSPHAAGSGDTEQTRRRGPREFVWSDGIGGVEKIRVDLAGTPRLLAALDTTANPTRRRRAREDSVA